MNDMLEKLEAAWKRLQELDIAPTVGNMEKLLQSLYEIREVYRELEKREDEDGRRAEADPEGRDGH